MAFQRVKLVIFIFKDRYNTEKKHFYGVKKKTTENLRPRCLTLIGKSNRHMPVIVVYFTTFIVLPSVVLITLTPKVSSFTCIPLSVYIALRPPSVEV